MASRSLGTLTVDLIAKTGGFKEGFSQAERISQNAEKEINARVKAIGVGITTAFSAVAAAGGALAVNFANTSREIEKLSALSGTTNEQFQRLAFGAATVRIEQEKLADIFKDTQDKVGDFIATGGGPLADFFERIAPLVGVTAEQFRELSGPQALQLYFDSLQKANVSQTELIFYLEAIASDASTLIPLLKDGGAGFQEFGDQAARAGAILRDDQIAAGIQLDSTLKTLQLSLKGTGNVIGAELVPAFNSLAETVKDPSFQAGLSVIAQGIALIGNAAAEAIREFGGFVSGIQSIGKKLTGTETELDRVDKRIRDIKRAISDPLQGPSEFLFTPKAKLEAELKALEKQRKAIDSVKQAAAVAPKAPAGVPAVVAGRPAAVTPSFAKPSGGGKSGVEREAESLTRQYETLTAQLREQIALFDDRTNAARIAYDLENSELKKLTQAQKDALLAQAQALDELQQRQEGEDFLSGQAEKLDALRERYATEEELQAQSYAKQLAELEAFKAQGLLTEQEYAELSMEVDRERANQMASLQQQQLADAGNLFGSLGQLVSGFAGEQSGIAQSLFAVQKAFSIASSIVAIQTGIANALALGFPAGLAAAATVAANAASIVSTIQSTNLSFDGGGYTGMGARAGGLDGKGGFMAMLHPNETVIDHTRGQRMGGATVIQNIQTSDATSFMYSQRQISRRAKRGLATS